MNNANYAWGIPLLIVTILVGVFIPYSVNLWLIVALTVGSIILSVSNTNVSRLVPAVVAYVGTYFIAIELFDVSSVIMGWIFIGIAIVAIGFLNDSRQNYRWVANLSWWIGGLMIGVATLWWLTASLHLDDNIRTGFRNVMHEIDPNEGWDEEVPEIKEATKATVSERAFDRSQSWLFQFDDGIESSVNFTVLSSDYIEYRFPWKTDADTGYTTASIDWNENLDLYSGTMRSRLAGQKTETLSGDLKLNPVNGKCLTGEAKIGNEWRRVKLYQKDVRCEL